MIESTPPAIPSTTPEPVIKKTETPSPAKPEKKKTAKRGRPESPRNQWFWKQHAEHGLTAAQLRDKWNGLSEGERKRIDPKYYKTLPKSGRGLIQKVLARFKEKT